MKSFLSKTLSRKEKKAAAKARRIERILKWLRLLREYSCEYPDLKLRDLQQKMLDYIQREKRDYPQQSAEIELCQTILLKLFPEDQFDSQTEPYAVILMMEEDFDENPDKHMSHA